MNKSLLQILACPITHKGLSIASDRVLMTLNEAIQAGQLTNRGGNTLEEILDQALVSDDGKVAYPIRDGVPVLLEAQSINMEQLG